MKNNFLILLTYSLVTIIALVSFFLIMHLIPLLNKSIILSNEKNKVLSSASTIKNFSQEKHMTDNYIQNKRVKDVLDATQLTYVAHACGRRNYQINNSLEALKDSYNEGYRLIEVDFNWTTDDIPVAIHDWYYSIQYFFEEDKLIQDLDCFPLEERNVKVNYEQFKKLKMKDNCNQFSLKDLIELISTDEYKDLYIVTDVKEENIKLLEYIINNYSYLSNRFIPQVYNQEEYRKAKDLGYNDIIYTLYLSKDSLEEIVDFSKKYIPFAITMDTSWAYSTLPLELSKNNIFTYAHTINKEDEFELLKTNGIKGIYTDILLNK